MRSIVINMVIDKQPILLESIDTNFSAFPIGLAFLHFFMLRETDRKAHVFPM